MVPSAFVLLPSLPLSTTGKLDRAALAASEPFTADASDAYVAPRTPIEAQLAAIWTEVLSAPRVGIHDDFFALGGHSLVATRVVSRVRDAFRVALPLRALFERPTVAGLSEVVETLIHGEGGPVGRADMGAPLNALSGADVVRLPEADVDTMLAAYVELDAAEDPTTDPPD